MATINQLLKQPGPFITTLLPDFQEAARLNNEYVSNQLATALFEKMQRWGGDELRPQDIYFNLDNKGSVYKEFTNAGAQALKQNINVLRNSEFKGYQFNTLQTTLINNFIYKLNSFDMGASNAWLDFTKAYALFHKMVKASVTNGIGPCYKVNKDGTKTLIPCDTFIKKKGQAASFFYGDKFGDYKRPLLRGDGTGFHIVTPDLGGQNINTEVEVGFNVPADCPPMPLYYCNADGGISELHETYFVLYDGTDDKVIFWYDYTGQGVQPQVPSTPIGVNTYVKIDIAQARTGTDLKALTDAAIDLQGVYATKTCPPMPLYYCNSDSMISRYERNASGASTKAEDGANNYVYPDTDMYSSDGVLLASNVVSNEDWVATSNGVRRPYEMNENNLDVMYLLLVDITERPTPGQSGEPCDLAADPCCLGSSPDCPCCTDNGVPDPCIPCFIILQTNWEADIEKLPINKPGYVGDNRNKRGRKVRLWK